MDIFERVEFLATLERILPPRHYRLIVLRFYDRYPVRDICRIMRLPTIHHFYRLQSEALSHPDLVVFLSQYRSLLEEKVDEVFERAA